MRRTSFILAAALVVGAANLSAQTPNFAGTWTRIVDPSAPAMGGRGSGVPDALTISQDSKTLTMIDESMGSNAPTLVFNLDGTESKQARTDGSGNRSEVTSHAKWDGSKLVVTMSFNSHGTSGTFTFTYSLDASGNLAIGVTRPSSGGEPVTTTSTFKKS